LKELATISVDDYLAGEPLSDVRHEYIGGKVHGMAGGTKTHNHLTLNLATCLRAHLRGKPCRVFMVDLKVRLQISQEDIFYYPDVVVACDPRDTERSFVRYPKVVIEVLSADTERIDRGEKFLSYTGIETLEEYILVAQDKMEVTIFRRQNNWWPEILPQAEETLRLPSIGVALPLSMVYEGSGI
jgi:Uma2 family endonuclease